MTNKKTYAILITYLIFEIAIVIIDIIFFNFTTGILLTIISVINLLALLFYRFFPEIKGLKLLFIYLANLIVFFYFTDSYEVSYFDSYAIYYVTIGIAIGTLFSIIDAKIFKHNVYFKNCIIPIICSGILMCVILSFVNVRLDFSNNKTITATVTDKSSHKSSYEFLYSLDITAKNDNYEELTFGVDYKKSKETNIGDSINISYKNGLFGEKYYYCNNIRFKDFYYDFWSFIGISVDDDDEFHSYIESIYTD
jgi:hypothetical protein